MAATTDYFGGKQCPTCGGIMDWIECGAVGCEDGHYDAYELDDPLWYDPGDMERCDECDGKGGWWHCFACARAKEASNG